MKKLLIPIILITIMLYSSTNVFAKKQPMISVSSSAALPGDEITLSVSISSNPGINSYSLGFDYDKTQLVLLDVKQSGNVGGQFYYKNRAVWLSNEDSRYDGEIMRLYFKVKDDAKPGEYKVSVTYSEGDIINYSEKDVNFTLSSGIVSIGDKEKENQKLLLFLQKIIAVFKRVLSILFKF